MFLNVRGKPNTNLKPSAIDIHGITCDILGYDEYSDLRPLSNSDDYRYVYYNGLTDDQAQFAELTEFVYYHSDSNVESKIKEVKGIFPNVVEIIVRVKPNCTFYHVRR